LALPVIYGSQDEIVEARKRLESKLVEMESRTWKIDDPLSTVGQTNFFLAYQGSNDREIQTRIAAIYLKSCPDLGFVADHCALNLKATRKRIRLGFVSAFLGSHTIGKLFFGLVKGLDLNKFEIFLFHLGSDRRAEDKHLAALSRYVDHFIPVPSQYLRARETVADNEVDILYYTDIGMEPLSYFLAFNRLAPIQCVTWGHPITTGIPNIDYFISWQIHEPHDAKGHYSEELVLFSGFCTKYLPPDYQSLSNDHGDFGLNGDERLYVCPQSLFKFHPLFDGILFEILQADEFARIVILEGQQKSWGQLLKKRFSNSDPVLMKRITILPRLNRKDYLNLMKLADVILDTPVFCGGNSTFEALAAGKIVVTLPGKYMRGLFTAGVYIQLGLEDLIPNSPEEYVKMAVALATDSAKRAKQELRIKERWPLIFNNSDTVHSHEKFFIDAWASEKNKH
jgi:predicted O-linked N-acetylglucosamine transferase (SPINDLY family)